MTRMILVLTLAAAGCGPQVDLSKAVVATSVTTGWADGGTVAGRNKIVPAVAFQLKNASDRSLGTVQVNAVFRRVNDASEWSSGYLPNASRALAPGAETGPLVAKGVQGYTGTDSREALLKNSHFVDAKAELFVKSGGSKWTRIGEFPIARQIVSEPPPPSRTTADARRDRKSAP